MIWLVIYTKPQQEKKVVLGLMKIGIESYCPIVSETRQWSDRKKKIEVPLIKSYVFVKISAKDRNRVFEIPGVMRFLFWLGKPAEVKDSEIESLRTYITGSYQSVKVEDLRLGNTHTINYGPFKDQSGEIVRVGSKKITIFLEQMRAIITILL